MDPTFILVVHQPNGCDYRIECGTKVVALKASNLNDAYLEVAEIIIGIVKSDPRHDKVGSRYVGEQELSAACLYHVTESFTIDLSSLYQMRFLRDQVERHATEQEQKRATYERLKKELGES